MSTYDPSIPQPTDLLSTSQGELLTNFTQLNSQFGVEHTPFNNGGSNGDGLHLQATMPNVAAPSPTPNTGYGTYYGSKTGTLAGTITEAVYISGDAANATNVAILSAIKAWGTFTASNPTATAVDGFNFGSVAYLTVGNYDVTFTNALPNTHYGVLATCGQGGSANANVMVRNLSTSGFRIIVSTGNPPVTDYPPITFMVLQS